MLRRQLPHAISAISLITLAVLGLPAAQAATFTVTTLSDSGSGSLRQAVLDANATPAQDTITFQSGLSGTIVLTGSIELTGHTITINGPGASVLAVSGTPNSLSVFALTNYNAPTSPTVVTINGLTIKNGTHGIRNQDSTLIVNNCTISGNSDSGILNVSPYHNSTLTISNSTLSGNLNGGIFNSGTLTLNNSTLSGNKTGGGISNSGLVTIINSTVSGNSASVQGGGIYNSSKGTVRIINSTLSGNTAAGNPYGVAGGGIFSAGILTLGNSVLSGNSIPTGATGKDIYIGTGGTFTSLGHNLFGENGSSGLVNANPVASDKILPGAISTAIANLADNGGPTQTQLPVVGSPAINAGNNTLIPTGVTTDQRGANFPRIVNTTVDIGAVEAGTAINDPATTLLTHYYTSILGRTPDAEGLAFWKNQITQAQASGQDVKPIFREMAVQFFNSPEYLANNTSNTEFITNLYRTFFQRDPDSAGMTFWLNQLALGVTREVVVGGSLYSTEFTTFMQSLGF